MELYKAALELHKKQSEATLKQSEVTKVALEQSMKQSEVTKVALEQSMKQSEVTKVALEQSMKQSEVTKVALEQSMKQSEVAIEAKDDVIRNLQQQLLMSRGLLTARGIYEQQLLKCLVEMKRLKLCSSNMNFNATGVIMKIMELQANLPEGGPSVRLVKKAAECKSDLITLFSTLSKEIHGAPWSGPGIKVHLSQLRKEDQCLIQYLADDLGLELVENK